MSHVHFGVAAGAVFCVCDFIFTGLKYWNVNVAKIASTEVGVPGPGHSPLHLNITATSTLEFQIKCWALTEPENPGKTSVKKMVNATIAP